MNRPCVEPTARVLRDLPDGAQPLRAIPDDVPQPDLASGNAWPSAVYTYVTEEGRRAFLVRRMETATGKQILPLSVWQTPDGQCEWYAKALPDARPLYRLQALVQAPEKVVLLSEGEKCADAVAAFSTFASTTWSGGSNAIAKTDFAPLAGRDVILLPDLDAAGAKAADQIAERLGQLGAQSVRRLDMQGLADRCGFTTTPGFDIADAIALGLDETRFAELLEDPAVLAPAEATAPTEAPANGKKEDPIAREARDRFGIDLGKVGGPFTVSVQGVIKHDVDRRGNPVQIYAGSPCLVLGRTRAEGGGWGYLIALRTPAESWETLVIPARLLACDGRDLRGLLADAGAIVPQTREGRQAQAEYIGYAMHQPIVRIASRPGWHGDSFALPQGNIRGALAQGDLMLDMGARQHFLAQAGTMKGWRDLARLVEDNSRGCFAISAALAPVLLRILDRQGGGFHLFGTSSRGKTTLLTLAGSVWGGGGTEGFVRNWRMTDNGAEATLADHNDLLLPLDEMTAATPELVAEVNYLFANGHGKSRAHRDGSARAVLQTRLIVLSSGEHASAQKVASGRGRTAMTGGQAVRMIDVPIGASHGKHAADAGPDEIFEDLAGFDTPGALTEALAALSKTHYGHAGPAFVQAIIDRQEEVRKEAEQIIRTMIDSLVEPGDDPQLRRVAARFGLVAAAAAIASDAGIVPWARGAGALASATCFRTWKDWRGGGTSQEETSALANVKAFFEAHGRTRFEQISGSDGQGAEDVPRRADGLIVRDRCGYFAEQEEEDKGPIYYVLPEAFRREVCGDHEPDLVLDILKKHGALHYDSAGGRLQKTKRLPDFPSGKKVYALEPDKLP